MHLMQGEYLTPQPVLVLKGNNEVQVKQTLTKWMTNIT